MVTAFLEGISAMLEPPTQADKQRFVDGYESAAQYTAASPDFAKLKIFHTLCIARIRHDEILRRPHNKVLWDAAQAQEVKCMADMSKPTPAHAQAVQPGDFAT